ncbi:MAG: family 78 glycoside hydrolase catalytic domain [Christensenellales bacterium]|jgi:alpha-L-rhamnosidase
MIRITNIRAEYMGGNREGFIPVSKPDSFIDWAITGSAPTKIVLRVAHEQSGECIWEHVLMEEAYGARYAGEPLRPGHAYWLTVEATNADGFEDCGGVQIRNIALPEWHAAWLGEEVPEADRILHFQKTVVLPAAPVDAIGFFATTGYHGVTVNGIDLSEFSLSTLNPSVSNYAERCYYQALAPLPVTEGENTIEVFCASGWRSAENACYKLVPDRHPPFIGQTLFSASILFLLEDGTEFWVHTDESWDLADDGYANLFDGYRIDANRRDIPKACKEYPCPTKRISPMLIPPVVERETYSPVSVHRLPDGAYAVDFGQNIAGICALRLPAQLQQGDAVSITHMEFLDEDGSLYLPPLRYAQARDEYVANGEEDGAEFFQPRFTYHGFRYCEVRGYPVPLTREDIAAIALYTDVASGSFFRCGSPMANAVHHNCVQTEKANIHSILTDCPQRDERMGWMNDATARFEETPYNFDVARLFPKIVRDLIDEQPEDGAIACTAPFVYGSRPADPVCSSFLVAGWQAYLFGGNIDVLKDSYEAWCKWDDCLEAHSENGIVQYSYYGDWAAPAYACVGEEDAHNAFTPGILMSTGYHYYNNILLSKIARVIGLDDAKHVARAEKIRRSFLEAWWHPETCKVCEGSQGAQVFALWLGILPEEGRKGAAKVLRDDLVARDYRFTTGNLCTRYLPEVLAEYGYVNEAWNLLTGDKYPSWGYMIQNEATTAWERFELKKDPGMNSHNHPMYAACDRWFYAVLMGAKPLSRGWETAEVRPVYPDSLLSAQTAIETPRGELEVRWVKRYGEKHLYITVPNGITVYASTPEGERTLSAGYHYFHAPI